MSNLRLPWKTEFALKFFAVLNIFFSIHNIFEQFVLALKNIVCPEFTALNIYYSSFRILNNLRLPWKTSLPWNFSLYWIIFYLSEFEQLALALNFSLSWNIFIFQDFWATCACPENKVCPEFFKPGGGKVRWNIRPKYLYESVSLRSILLNGRTGCEIWGLEMVKTLVFAG